MVNAVSKAVLVTGCSSGIGRATAERLARDGWTVYATARRAGSIADLAQYGCRLLELDVTDEKSMAAAVTAVEDAEGAVGVLVNNAGFGLQGAFETVSVDEVRRQFETNVFGLIALTQLVLPGMRRQRWGRVVNMSSMGGRLTLPGGAYYHASKYAVEAITDALRYEVQPFGVDVVAIEPGVIRTPFGDAAMATVPAAGDGHDPYARFNAEMTERLRTSYHGAAARLTSGGPDAVAAAVAKALSARRPRTRYPVTPMAHGLIAMRRLLPDRAWDAFLRRQFPTPDPDQLRGALDPASS